MSTECFGSRYFMSWFAEQGISLAFSAYKTNNVFLIGPNGTSGMTIGKITLTRAMGLAASADCDTLYIGAAAQLWKYDRVPCDYSGFDSAYIPRVGYTTGDVDIHEIVVEDSGRPVFVNTAYSCLATTSDTHSFKPIWTPPFISKLAAEDRCHLNGLALRDGKARYVTFVSQSNVMGQWRESRHDGGCVMDITTNEVIAEGLSMPHSPRWHDGKLWLHNSGTGHFGYIDDDGKFEAVCFCPGFLRGLHFVGNHALVGLSRLRENTKERCMEDLELERTLEEQRLSPRCGIYAINLKTGDIDHALNIEGETAELFDIITLPGVEKCDILDFNTHHVNKMISFESEEKDATSEASEFDRLLQYQS